MNAKKIMGAVLVALLAAALFIGVGAAAVDDKGTIYTYVKYDWLGLGDTFSASNGQTVMAQTITYPDGTTGTGFAIENFVSNVYYQNATIKFKLAAPNANVFVTKENGKSVIDGIALTTDSLNFTVGLSKDISSTVTLNYNDLTFIDVDGVATTGLPGAELNASTGNYEIKNVSTGKWGVKANLENLVAKGGPKYSSVFNFTIDKATKSINVKKETILTGENVVVSLTGAPNTNMIVAYDKKYLTVVPNQPGVTNDSFDAFVLLGADGIGSIAFTATTETGSTNLKIKDDSDKKVSITIKKGTITGTIEAASVFIGDDVKLKGTFEGGKKVYFYMAGTNFNFKQITGLEESVNSDNSWKTTIKASDIKAINNGKRPDAGTYTIYIASNNAADKVGNLSTYSTVSLALKQPFITITDAPSVAVQGSDYVVKGTAEATEQNAPRYYIFGTNFFDQSSATMDKNEFKIEQKIDKDKMDAGQYFVVIQHPMYDQVFNLRVDGNKDVVVYNSSGLLTGEVLFNVDERQTTNAAQAFCDALDSQNIDDMYVKASFVVAAPTSVINPIAPEITKGSTLTVSGTTNMGEGKLVTVEMLSTAFAAVPKATVGSASFIALTTKTDKDGNWVVEFDTTGLNVDEYTVTAAVDQLGSATAKINVIEGAPVQPTETVVPTETQQPTQPTQTQQPTTPPKTPGFGALAALAGLGAVAVLLLRRE